MLGAGAAAAGVAVAVGGTALVGGTPGAGPAAQPATTGRDQVPFDGAHQAGIATAVQDRLHIVAFSVTGSTTRESLIAMLTEWTAAARRMTAGREVGTGSIPAIDQAPPDDTGEAANLPASRLTLTIGFGPALFTERFGLADHGPEALIDLPRFAADQLDPAKTGGDIVIQACADDPQVAVHAVRNLIRIGFGTVAVKWAQLGFGKTSSTTPEEMTPRNLFGFKDGTSNIATHDDAALEQHVWVDAAADQAPPWLDGGTYLIARRISMRIETWDRTNLFEQEQLIGRTKAEGAPLGRTRERDLLVPSELPVDSHVRLAHPDLNDGHKLLRRGYSFVDGTAELGRLDAGLFFIAFARDPRTQYVPMQSRLSSTDALMEYLVHTGSGLWVVPPGMKAGEYWGQSLFEA